MARKLTKSIEGNVLTITEAETQETLSFDFSTLPSSIQEKFGPFGMGHKLGDAAAGKHGQDAVDSINKVWEGLMAENWSVRAPAAPKITKKELNNKIAEMDPEEAAAAAALLAKLGVTL